MTLHPPKRRRSSAPPSHPPAVTTSNDGVLPLDLLYDILLRLPTETLCRLRAVGRSWRSLLYHPDFIAAAHNPGPLIAVGIKDYCSGNEVTVLDMESGNAVTRVNVAANDHVYGEAAHAMSHDRVVCVVDPRNRLRLLDLVNGVVSLLPDHAPPLGYPFTCCTVGRGASTEEHKVLAIATSGRYHEPEICKILTLGLSDNSGWRDTGSASLKVVPNSDGVAVINGVAYFQALYAKFKENDVYARGIMVFDFNSEEWRPPAASLQGPVNCHWFSLAELEGHLVACHADRLTSSIELWFLMDLDRSLWFKRYTINMPCHQSHQPPMYYAYEYLEKPLAVLDGGRIVMWFRVLQQGCSVHEAVLRIYNPRTKTFKDGIVVPRCSCMSLFTWNLLHPGQKGALDDAAKHLLIDRDGITDLEHHPPLVDARKNTKETDLIPARTEKNLVDVEDCTD